MLRKLSSKIPQFKKKEEGEPPLLDTDEQEELIEKFRRDNERTNRFHRTALKISGWIIALMKLLCVFIQIFQPWILPMHEAAKDFYPSVIVILLELYSSAFSLYFSFYICDAKMQENNKIALTLVGAVLIQFLLGLVMWWPNIVIPLWFCGGTLMYAFVILYSDSTLKSTARDIDKLKDLMYPFKKL